MDDDICLFQDSEHCNCVRGNIGLKVISDTRFETIILKSKKRNDDLHLRTVSSEIVLKTHEACISRYTSDYRIEKYLNRKKKEKLANEPPPVKKTRRASGVDSFVWKLHCLFCGESCLIEKDPKNPNRWRKAKECRTSDRGPNTKSYKDYLLKVRYVFISSYLKYSDGSLKQIFDRRSLPRPRKIPVNASSMIADHFRDLGKFP